MAIIALGSLYIYIYLKYFYINPEKWATNLGNSAIFQKFDHGAAIIEGHVSYMNAMRVCAVACMSIYFATFEPRMARMNSTSLQIWSSCMHVHVLHVHACMLRPACHHGINCPERHGQATTYLEASDWCYIAPISMHDAHMHVDLMHAWSTHVARDSR